MSIYGEIAICVIAAIFVLGHLFFLMAIWRALLGKSTVDLGLSVAIKSLGKRMETLSANTEGNSRAMEKTGEKLNRKLTDLDRGLQKAFKENGSDSTRVN
jgi:hypothetical protein